jgi:hypothetical protein
MSEVANVSTEKLRPRKRAGKTAAAKAESRNKKEPSSKG